MMNFTIGNFNKDNDSYFDNENKLGKLYTEWKDWSNKEQYGIHKKV